MLSDAAALKPTTGEIAVGLLLPLAYGLAAEVYPHLLEPDVNYFPWWLPLWSPQPAYTLRRPPLPRRTPLRRLKLLAGYCADLVRQGIFSRLAAKQRQHYRWRKQVAAILAARRRLGPGMLGLLLENDERFVLEVQYFLNDHGVPFDLPRYGPGHEYLFAAPEKVEVLAGALRHAVGRGRDNELFVLLADLLEIPDRLDPLLAAVKMALARHHAVLVVCPWPPGVPPPSRSAREADKTQRLCRAYDDVRHTFARLGVPVTCARHDESVPLILNRLERLRMLERGVR